MAPEAITIQENLTSIHGFSSLDLRTDKCLITFVYLSFNGVKLILQTGFVVARHTVRMLSQLNHRNTTTMVAKSDFYILIMLWVAAMDI